MEFRPVLNLVIKTLLIRPPMKQLVICAFFWFCPGVLWPQQDEIFNSEIFQHSIERLDCKDQDLRDVFRLLAARYQLNLNVDNAIDRRVTLHLRNVGLEDALRYILSENRLTLEKTGAIYRITALPDPPPVRPDWQVVYREGRLSADFTNAEIHEVLRRVSEATGVTLLADRGVSGTVDGVLKNVPLEEGLRQLLISNGFELRSHGSVLRVQRPYDQQNTGTGAVRIDIRRDGEAIRLELRNAVLQTVLDRLAEEWGISFVLLEEAARPVTARIRENSLEKALALLLIENELTFRQQGEVYLIGHRNNKMMGTSRLFRLKYLKVEGVTEMLPQELIRQGEFKAVREHNALLVCGPREMLEEVSQILSQLDRPIPQVFLEALVVDFNRSSGSTLGIEAGSTAPDSGAGLLNSLGSWIPGLDLVRGGSDLNRVIGSLNRRFNGVHIGQLPGDFYLRVKALEREGKANIRSRPQIATLNGHTAELKIGETRYFKLLTETPIRDPSQLYLQTSERFHSVEINISLKITPWVSASGEITVEIEPEFNTPIDQNPVEGVPPNIRSRSLKSTVRLRDGETIVLGGLIQEMEDQSVSRVPLLGRIPLLGRLFASRSSSSVKSELIIYVTPRLSYSEAWLIP